MPKWIIGKVGLAAVVARSIVARSIRRKCKKFIINQEEKFIKIECMVIVTVDLYT